MARAGTWFRTLTAAAIASCVAGPMAAGAGAAPEERTALREWSGSVADDSLRPGEGGWLLIRTAEELAGIWRAWGRREEPPEVDFTTELVVAQTAKGSVLRSSYRLREDGDLEVLGIATPDYLPGFRYLIATLSRQGVTSVNGRTLAGARGPGHS